MKIIRAAVDRPVTVYRIAFAKLEQVTGTTLKAKGLRFRDYEL